MIKGLGAKRPSPPSKIRFWTKYFGGWPLTFPSPLEVGPLNTARGSEEALKAPQRVWGRAPAEIEFVYFSLKI